MRPTDGVDHWPCRMRSSTELSSQTSLPVFLLSAMIDGARGDGMLTWLSSWPFDVLTKIRSPQTTGDEFARLCGYAPTSSIMSNDQITSASIWPVSFSSVTGPSFSLSRKPWMSRQKTTPRLLDVVEAVALDERRRGDALERPVVGAARLELRVRLLPEELAVRLAERHQHAAIAAPASDRAAARCWCRRTPCRRRRPGCRSSASRARRPTSRSSSS